MSDDEYWTFGRKETICVLSGIAICSAFSLMMRAPPPWWFLPSKVEIDRAAIYASQGGYEAFWLQSLIGWAVAGAVVGLIFSNVILRGKSWD